MSTRRISTPRQSTIDVSQYLGPRNKNRITPKVNINYTSQALNTTAKRKEADAIAAHITSLFDSPFIISVYPGGIGDVVFALEESPLVAKIYVSEPNNGLRQLLINNIQAYRMGNRIEVTPNYEREDASVLYIDTIKDPKFNIRQTLEQGLFPVYAFRVVAGYNLPENQTCTLEETGNPDTALLICQGVAQEEKVEEGLSIDEQYLQGFIQFMDKVLSRIIPEPEERSKYLTDDLISTWIQAFTHQTIDPNFNYEVLEMLGDRFMKAGFADYLIQRIPKITERKLTELQNYYLTTIPQSGVAKSLGFEDWIRIVGTAPVKVFEDVLEAFFGALFRVSEEVAGGRGYYNVFTMIVSLYQDEPIEQQMEVVKEGRDKTVVIQSLSKLHLKPPIENFYEERGLTHFTLTLQPTSREFFEGFGKILPPMIGHGIGNSRKRAETVAYNEALTLMRERGVTPEWIEEQRAIFAFNRPEYQPYLPTARARLSRDGFTKMTFSSPVSTTTTRECIVQLIGHRPDGSQHILATVQACDQHSGRIEVLRKYASGE